ncbi:uncharacterized protein MAL13P1.336-like isoform X2 [Maniola jurtina]|uniref:uncharacterized protein MAL13P1.336-like isoform X2 n=1 Tax=Maniola jurtina TaxID=191418 RepID=UPI001E68E44C|nr:uncharacterized protein MAL13P1.336-like isoform X2 [Maniola jurtina]
MNKILFLILVCKNVIASDEEINDKYIDLLPEEEKQEFLNRIARRILEGIQSNDTPNESHVEITDDQLDAQDAFVKEILKEESDNLKNEKRLSENKEADENDQGETNNDHLNENYDAGVESNTGDKEEHIDLTLREGKRQKRTNGNSLVQKETTTEMSYDVIPVKIVYDQFKNDDVKINSEPMLASLKENSTIEQEGTTTNVNDEITINSEKEQKVNVNHEESVAFVDNLENSSDLVSVNKENLGKSFHNKFQNKLETAEMVDFERNPNETVDYNINDGETSPLLTTVSEEVTDRTASDAGTQKIYDNSTEEKEKVQEEKTTIEYSTTSNNVTETIKETTTSSTVATETSIGESTNTAISLHNRKDTILRSITDSSEHEDIKTGTVTLKTKSTLETTSLSTRDNTSLSEPISEVVNDTSESKDMEKLDINESSFTKNEHNMTLGNPEVVKNVENEDIDILFVSKSENISTSKDTVNVNTVEHSTERANSSEKLDNNKLSNNTVSKARPDNIDESQIDENEYIKNIGDDSNNVKVYEVFEVDPNQPHFMTTGKPSQNEHPLYAPVYNYAPENAYFRPYNKFGPNEDSKQFVLIDARNRFSGFNKDKKSGSSDTNLRNTKQSSKKQKPNQYHGFIKPVTVNLLNQEIYYNPDDYADYYFGRILRTKKYRNNNPNNDNYKTYFPDSNEEEHPMNRISKRGSIKDFLKAVRNISYHQNLFGFAPQVSERPIRKTNEFFQKFKKSKTPKIYPISLDYYFDRADPDIKKERFRSNKSKLKPNIDINIVPVTPNPQNYETDFVNIPEKQDLETDSHSKSINQEINDLPFKKLFDSMIVVLKDSVQVKNEKLVKYNWLETTVNIQAALRKLLDLIQQLKDGTHVHPKDIELMKYTIYLFKSSKIALEEESMNRNSNRNKDSMKTKKSAIKFPKTKIKTKIKDPLKLWKNFATFLRSEEKIEEQRNNLINDFEDLLENLLFNLNDLHDAIKHISIITEYKNQNWLQDLNFIYLEKGNKKNLAKIILHLSLSRLLDSIEDSSSLVEENFRNFVKKNREIVKKSKEECLFVLNVLEELRRLNE